MSQCQIGHAQSGDDWVSVVIADIPGDDWYHQVIVHGTQGLWAMTLTRDEARRGLLSMNRSDVQRRLSRADSTGDDARLHDMLDTLWATAVLGLQHSTPIAA